MSTDTKTQPATDTLAELVAETETTYRNLVTAMAHGQAADRDELLRVASATGRDLATVRTHRDRLKARFAAGEQLADESAITQRVQNSQAAAEQAQEKLDRAREKATKIVADATQAVEQANADHGEAFSKAQRVLDDARRTLAESADPAIDREATTLRKGLGLNQLEAAKGHNPGLRLQVVEKEAAMRSLGERKLDPIAGMNWS
ncbi:MAG TPA: hypothetical protein VMY37_20055 [Thermoguttaceae bacterium]|nr:hypothetical protein [Thermoguttaceae bacterium]